MCKVNSDLLLWMLWNVCVVGGSLALWAMEMVQVAKVFNATYSNVPGAMDLRTFMWRTQVGVKTGSMHIYHRIFAYTWCVYIFCSYGWWSYSSRFCLQ